MNKDLLKGITFQVDEKKRLGTMRIDWADGELCNQWNPTNLLTGLKTGSKIGLGKLQQELNHLQFGLLPSFQMVERLCCGNGYDKEQIFSISLEHFNFVVRLIPVKDAYSHIYVYLK